MNTITENKTRIQIENAIINFVPSVTLEEAVTYDNVKSIIRIFMRNHPEIFWFSHQYLYDSNRNVLYLKYNFTKEKVTLLKKEIDNVIKDEFQIDYVRSLSELERVVYVYKWIAERTTYNEYSSFNQTIFSVLINRNSVCTGYAKTAQYLLALTGVESKLVFGKFHSDKSDHGHHGWNIVRIDGNWYHVDFCLADKSLCHLLNDNESPILRDSILWNYFGVSTEKILSNRSIECIENLPDCIDSLSNCPTIMLRQFKVDDSFYVIDNDEDTEGAIIEDVDISNEQIADCNFVGNENVEFAEDLYDECCCDDGPISSYSYDVAPDNSQALDSEIFASTCRNSCSDGGIHDADSFACTAAISGMTVPNWNELSESYHPCKSENKNNSKIGLSARKGSCNNIGIGNVIGNAIGGLLGGCCVPQSFINKEDETSKISACVYAPAQIQARKTFIIRVYLYKPEESDLVDSKVKNLDHKAVKKEYRPLDIPVKNGDTMTVQLKMSDGISLDKNTKTVIWRDHFTDCSFMAKLSDPSIDDVFGSVYVSVNGIPAGEMLFTIDVVESQEAKTYAKVESKRFSRIFISYSHQDETQVRGFAECCRALGTDYFFDRHTLNPGDIFKEKILKYINDADLFVLCWSKNAANSEWVQIERQHAMSIIKEGKGNLTIYPLSLTPEAPLPIDMSNKYNFGIL